MKRYMKIVCWFVYLFIFFSLSLCFHSIVYFEPVVYEELLYVFIGECIF